MKRYQAHPNRFTRRTQRPQLCGYCSVWHNDGAPCGSIDESRRRRTPQTDLEAADLAHEIVSTSTDRATVWQIGGDGGHATLSQAVAIILAVTVMIVAGLNWDAGGETFTTTTTTTAPAGLIDAQCVETLPGAWDDGKLNLDTETQECQ